MTAAEPALDPRLLPLLAAPWDRAAHFFRVGSVVERYRMLAELARDPPPSVEQERALTLELLFRHPSALLERTAIAPDEITRRLELAGAELENLRMGAPLPPPPDRTDRARILALGDVEWLMRELRHLRRGLKRLPPVELLRFYRSEGREDPIPAMPEANEELLRAIGRIKRGRLFRVAAQLAGMRHGIAHLRSAIAPQAMTGAGRSRDLRTVLELAPAGGSPRQAITVAGRPPPQSKVHVCPASAITEGTSRAVRAFGRTVAVFRDQGELKAIDDECPHRGGPLNLGEIEDGAVICPLHGWCFDLSTGRMRGAPQVRVPIYEVTIEDGEAYVGPQKT